MKEDNQRNEDTTAQPQEPSWMEKHFPELLVSGMLLLIVLVVLLTRLFHK